MSENLIQTSEENAVSPSVIGVGELDSNGLLKKKRADQEKLAAEYKAMQEAKTAEAEDTVETSQE